jgi:hypothetical protein
MARNMVNAWREILARIFADFAAEQNLSPEWLINPETKRPLKLDLVYPEIGLAIRFAGLRGAKQRAPNPDLGQPARIRRAVQQPGRAA